MKIKETDIKTHVVLAWAWIQKGNKFLLAKRSIKDPQSGGMWALPGGKVEYLNGISIVEETLKKEIREEVGIEITDNIKYLSSQGFIRISRHHVVVLDFLAQYKSGKAQALEDQEEVKWLTINEIENLIKKDKRMDCLKLSFYKLNDQKKI